VFTLKWKERWRRKEPKSKATYKCH